MGKTRLITEGAILLAIFLVLMLISLYVIGIGMITVFVLPLPFAIFTIKHGYKKSFILIIAAMLLSVIIGSVITIFGALMFASTGVVIGELFRRKKNDYFVMLAGSIVFLLNLVLIYVTSIVLFEINIINDALESAKDSISTASSFLESMGQTPDEKMLQELKDSFNTVQTLVPSAFIVGSLTFSFITLVICKPILKRLKLTEKPWPPFRELVLPKSILWYYLIVLILTFVQFEQGTFMFTALLNMFYLLQIAMIIQGFSFIAFYSYQKGYKKFITISIIVISFLIPFLMDIIRIIGIIDLGFNLRNKLTNDK